MSKGSIIASQIDEDYRREQAYKKLKKCKNKSNDGECNKKTDEFLENMIDEFVEDMRND